MTNENPIKLENSDLYDIDIFFKKHYVGKARYGTMGYFFWKIFNNPYRLGFVNLFKADDKIISATSITPKSLILNQSEVLAGEIGDTYTDPNYQGKGLFSKLINFSRKQANEEGIEFVYGTPNNQSLPGYKKNANFDILQSFDIRLLRYQVKIESILKPKIGWFFAKLVDFVFYIAIQIHQIYLSIILNSSKSYIIIEQNNVPDDWDLFWNKASVNWDFIFNKNSKSLSWRYLQNPEKYFILYVRLSEELVGFCSYRFVSDETGTNLIIADFLFLENHSSALNNCLKIIRTRGVELGVRSISLWCDSKSPYFWVFKKNGFLNYTNIPLISYQDKMYDDLKTINKIHFVMADSDNV